MDGRGTEGTVQIIFTIVPRCEVKTVVTLVKESNPNAFYTIEEVGFVEKGILPSKHHKGFTKSMSHFKPFRKGK